MKQKKINKYVKWFRDRIAKQKREFNPDTLEDEFNKIIENPRMKTDNLDPVTDKSLFQQDKVQDKVHHDPMRFFKMKDANGEMVYGYTLKEQPIPDEVCSARDVLYISRDEFMNNHYGAEEWRAMKGRVRNQSTLVKLEDLGLIRFDPFLDKLVKKRG